MLVNAVVYTFPPEHAQAAADILVQLATASRGEAGCLRFDIARSNDDPNVFVLYEEWSDEAALDRHYETELFIKLGVNGIRKLARARAGYKCTPLL